MEKHICGQLKPFVNNKRNLVGFWRSKTKQEIYLDDWPVIAIEFQKKPMKSSFRHNL